MEREINELRKILFIWAVIFAAASILFFPFSLGIFQKIYSDLVPNNIEMLITNPLNPFFIQIKVSLFLAFIVSLPILLFKFIKYLSPALHPKEKKIIIQSLIPSALLFVLGSLFAYFLLIPMTLDIMNSYNSTLKASIFFEVGQFVTFSLLVILVTGVSFVLPVFMKALSSLGLVSSSFWKKNFKYSLIAMLILSAIITPDGTGVTMLMLSFPLISLYSAGMFFSNKSKEVKINGNY